MYSFKYFRFDGSAWVRVRAADVPQQVKQDAIDAIRTNSAATGSVRSICGQYYTDFTKA